MKVAVIGAGSWGTAIAQLLASNGHDVALWARRESVASGINSAHKNPDYLKDETLSASIVATTDYAQAIDGAEGVVIVTPSRQMRSVAQDLESLVGPDLPIVICSKGVEEGTGMVPVEVFEDVLGNRDRLAALSGPNHAEEVVRGIPAGTVIASSNEACARFFQEMFATNTFRVYTSDDVLGVELCAASKNVIAIATGLSYGIGYGDNTAAMLITRGMAEMGRLVTEAGGTSITCMGLAGAGDLIATCLSKHSRNRRFGEMLASGLTLDDFSSETHMVAEGAYACKTLQTLSQRYNVELPITDMVRGVVWEGLSVEEAGRKLFARSLKPEFYGLESAQ